MLKLEQLHITMLELVATYPIATHQVMPEIPNESSIKRYKALQTVVLLHPSCGCHKGNPSIAINVNWLLYVVSYVATKWISVQ